MESPLVLPSALVLPAVAIFFFSAQTPEERPSRALPIPCKSPAHLMTVKKGRKQRALSDVGSPDKGDFRDAFRRQLQSVQYVGKQMAERRNPRGLVNTQAATPVPSKNVTLYTRQCKPIKRLRQNTLASSPRS